jgi:glycosyltransferase involved in cell wall biosynthesis
MAPIGRLNVVFVCQAVDQDDPILATTLRWIEALARKPSVDRVTVLALRTGRHALPATVEVRRFGQTGRFATVRAFYREVARVLRRRPDLFFIYQGGPYPLLLLPIRLLSRTAVMQWKAHPAISRAMAIYARWCDDLIFTPTKASFPMDLRKVRVVGHGVDTELFRPQQRPVSADLIAVGRITPRKHIAEMIEAVVSCNREFGTELKLDVYGPVLAGQEAHAAHLDAIVDRLGARDWVALHGPVDHAQMPAVLNGHRAFLNFSETAVDKAVIEAMACGLPLVSTNASVREIIPADLRSTLITDPRNPERQAQAVHDLLTRSDPELAAIGERMRTLAITEHGVDRLFDRILEDARGWLSDRR